ncbi:MAG: hypothetical protein IJ574_05615 [Bacilli bacterium]|nr:hypothetical protein [Bacilli bacterium]
MNLEDSIKNIINNNKLVKINDNIYLSKYQIEILDKYQINYNVSSVSEILFEIDEVLECIDAPDLEEVANSLQEFEYYNNTNK